MGRGYKTTSGFSYDITPEYIEYATKQAQIEKLTASFICSDIRNVSFHNEFDVVLNMADGAIGYLENEEDPAYEGYKIMNYKDADTPMQIVSGKAVKLETVRYYVGSVLIGGFAGTVVGMIYLVRGTTAEVVKRKKEA